MRAPRQDRKKNAQTHLLQTGAVDWYAPTQYCVSTAHYPHHGDSGGHPSKAMPARHCVHSVDYGTMANGENEITGILRIKQVTHTTRWTPPPPHTHTKKTGGGLEFFLNFCRIFWNLSFRAVSLASPKSLRSLGLNQKFGGFCPCSRNTRLSAQGAQVD